MSLKKIAAQSGVSVSTVSRILSGKYPKCASEEVKEKVWQAAKALQYQPNESARQLKAGEGQQAVRLGILFSRMRDAYSNQFFQTLIQAVSEECLRQGCQVGESMYTEHFLESDEAPPNGLIVLGRCSAQMLSALHQRCRRLICVGLNPYEPGYDQIICHGKVAAEMAMEYLLRKGHVRIGYVGECENEVRYLGYRNMLIREGIHFDRSLVYETTQSEEGGKRAAKRILDTEDTPSALFCANDATAVGVLTQMRALQPNSLRPAVISIDNTDKAQEPALQLTTINIPIREMGFLAVKLLLDRVQKGHSSPLKVEFPCSLVKRKSS